MSSVCGGDCAVEGGGRTMRDQERIRKMTQLSWKTNLCASAT